MKKTADRPPPATRTLGRRDLLEWLGRGTTLAIGGPTLASLLAACGDSPHHPPLGGSSGVGGGRTTPDDPSRSDRQAPDAGSDASLDVANTAGAYPYDPAEPTGHAVFDGWGERTADPQKLAAILSNWRLTVDGMVDSPLALSFSELLALDRSDLVADFHCVEGWSIFDVPYTGIRMSALLDLVAPRTTATHLTIRSFTGKYLESIPIDIARESKTMLAYGIAGSTIPLKHGFPLRLVIPRLLGYKNSKFVERIQLEDRPRDGYWVTRGYGYDGEVPPQRLREGKY